MPVIIKRAAKCRTTIICWTWQIVAIESIDNLDITQFNNIFIYMGSIIIIIIIIASFKSFIYRSIPPSILSSPPDSRSGSVRRILPRASCERTIPMGIEKSTGSSIRRRSFELSLFAIRAIHGHAWNDTIIRAIPRNFHSNPPLFYLREIREEVEWAKWSGGRRGSLRTLKKLINSISDRLIGLSWDEVVAIWRVLLGQFVGIFVFLKVKKW